MKTPQIRKNLWKSQKRTEITENQGPLPTQGWATKPAGAQKQRGETLTAPKHLNKPKSTEAAGTPKTIQIQRKTLKPEEQNTPKH